MSDVFESPLRELKGFEDLDRDLNRKMGPVLVSGCMDSQKVHSMYVRVKEQQIPGRIQKDSRLEVAEILVDLSGPGVIIRDHQFPGKRACLSQLVHEMYLLRIQGPCYLQRSLSGFQCLNQIVILL